ncbi:alpha/beta hydrolase [Corynebacterium doosanense]|nr:alpha/beta hydrolase [Corynebacterium doosanense]
MADKEPLHPQIADAVQQTPAAGDTPPEVDAARAAGQERVPDVDKREPQLGLVQDVTAVTDVGEVPVRIYADDATAGRYGVIVYVHGGAFFSGSVDTHDHVARALAKETGKKVISVDYSLAPEARFPTAIEQIFGVLKWIVQHDVELKWDEEVLALAGDAAGANLVAAVTFVAKDSHFRRITHQILYYPAVDLDFDEERYDSLKENAEGYGLETKELAAATSFYVKNGADPADPLVSPIKRKDLRGLPTALVITAGYDPLRDEGIAYAQRLSEAGVDVTHVRFESANHGFVAQFSWIDEFYDVFRTTAKFLRRKA